MSQRIKVTTKQTSDEEQLVAAALFVRKVGGIEQAKQALEQVKKLRKAG